MPDDMIIYNKKTTTCICKDLHWLPKSGRGHCFLPDEMRSLKKHGEVREQ